MPSKNFTCWIYGDIPDKQDPVSLQIIKQASKLFSQLYLKPKEKKTNTCESSIPEVGPAKKASSSRGGDGSPSSSSTTDGFTESGVPSAPTK